VNSCAPSLATAWLIWIILSFIILWITIMPSVMLTRIIIGATITFGSWRCRKTYQAAKVQGLFVHCKLDCRSTTIIKNFVLTWKSFFVQILSEHYVCFRPIRNDGSQFYRAFLFSYLVTISVILFMMMLLLSSSAQNLNMLVL